MGRTSAAAARSTSHSVRSTPCTPAAGSWTPPGAVNAIATALAFSAPAAINHTSSAELIAGKVRAYHERRNEPKGGTDWRDLALLLLAYPQLKTSAGEVRGILTTAKVEPAVLAAWDEIVLREIAACESDDEFE